ncbi:hypothetical protein TNCV_3158311 [Trichonephila clavipes]|nr:hypothetical protein TNCV_3158311 [Trichonephila clavipes]
MMDHYRVDHCNYFVTYLRPYVHFHSVEKKHEKLEQTDNTIQYQKTEVLHLQFIIVVNSHFQMLIATPAMSPSEYGGYDPRLVTEWVRIPSKTWSYLFGKVGLSPVMDPCLERKAARSFLLYAEIIICNKCVYSSVVLYAFRSSSLVFHIFPG